MEYHRIFAFGDSYIDNIRINKKSGLVDENDKPKMWIEKIVNFYKPRHYFNYGKSGSDSKYTIEKIKNFQLSNPYGFTDNDLLIVILSNNPPSDVDNNLNYQKYIEELSCSKIIFHNDYTEEYKSRNIFPLSLENISRYEINEKSDEIMKRRYDKRVNHLSWCNHKILFDCCVKFIDGNKYFSYDEFDYKFLKLDEAFHSETYESTKLSFIYD